MIKPEDLTEEELKIVAKYIDKKCSYSVSNALTYQYDVNLNECFGEFEKSNRKDEVQDYVNACNYFNCYDNDASDWLEGNY